MNSAIEDKTPTIDSIRHKLRHMLFEMLFQATMHHVNQDKAKVQWIHVCIENHLAFGVNCGLITMEERSDWQDVMAEKQIVTSVLSKWDADYKSTIDDE